MGQAPPAIGKPCAAREPQAEVSRGSRGSSSRSGALQLFVLVHGICGSSRDWEVWKNRLELRRRADWEVRASDSITPFSYFGGYEVHKLGELLAKQVAEWVNELLNSHQTVVLHFICHSLGGLVARAALPRICEWDLPGVVHGHFVTLNTPHLGVRGANLWMCWKNMGVLIPIKSFNQIHQLTLQDERSDLEPLREESGSSFGRRSARLLEELADPQSRYCQALARFKTRTAVAASHWDVIVPFSTAAICSTNPFPSPNIFAGHLQTFWRVDAAVGFKAGTRLAKCHQNGGEAAAAFERSLKEAGAAESFDGSDEASQASGESDGSLTPRRPRRQRWQRSSDYEVEFTPDMLKGLLMGPVWRRVVYTLHQPWVNADVHLFTIGKDRKVLGWSIEFIDLLISMFQDTDDAAPCG